MGRHRTAIAPTTPHTEEQTPKKRQREHLEPALDPKDHTNGDYSLVSAQVSDKPDSKKLKHENQSKKRKDKTRDATAYLDSIETTPVAPSGEAKQIEKHDGGVREPKKPKKEKKAKIPHDDEAQQQILDPEEEARMKKFEAIFAKYQKSAELAQAKKATAVPPVVSDQNEGESKPASAATELHGLTPFPQPDPPPESSDKPIFAALPSWLSKPIIVPFTATDAIKDLGLSTKLQDNLQRKGLQHTLAVQSAVIPLLIPGSKAYNGDICVSAATGSGKTLAYMIPMVENLKQKITTRLRGLVVVPTRELVAQAREVAEMCVSGTGLQIGTAVGNVPLAEEQERLVKRGQQYDPTLYKSMYNDALERVGIDFGGDEELQHDLLTLLLNHVPEYNSRVDILISTPGRLVDHIKKTRGFSLGDIDWLIIDEADRLLDDSFQEWVVTLLEALHPKQANERKARSEKIFQRIGVSLEARRVRKILLSATMTRDLSKLASLRLKRPTLVTVVDESEGLHRDQNKRPDMVTQILELPRTLQEKAIPVGDGTEKPLYLLQLLRGYLLRKDTEINRYSPTSVTLLGEKLLVFAHNNENASRLAYILPKLLGTKAGSIGVLTKMSTSSKTSRKTLKAFQRGEIQVLITTDRASRGLDVQGIAHVINYDVPANITSYVHRVGRTARAGNKGMAWTLYTDTEARWFWNEVARSERFRRGEQRIVEKMMTDMNNLAQDTRVLYDVILKELQSAVLGDDS